MSVTTASAALTAALEHLDGLIPPDAEPQQRLVAAKLRGLMIGYDARWHSDEWETISVEEEFHLPIINPETGAPSRTFTHAGKRDGIIRYISTGQTFLLEHKTTTDDITDPNAAYWRRLAIDSQVSQYMLACWQEQRKLDGTLYDVVRKPDIRPKSIPKGDTRKRHKVDGKLVEITDDERRQNNVGTLQEIADHGTYLGEPVESFGLDLQSVLDDGIETPELYGVRLAREALENPERYYQRRTIPRMDSEIVEFSGELWDVAKSILDAQNNNAHYRNSEACNQWNSQCEFLGVCSGHDSLESDKWEVGRPIHAELQTVDGRASVVTNSRVKCFQSCRRKHYYRYELGAKRIDDEEKEALYFGNLWHALQEIWWSCFIERV